MTATTKAVKRKASQAAEISGGETCIKVALNNDAIVAGVDAWSRVAATQMVGGGDTAAAAAAAGRGSLSGWTHCPICETYSKKKYALGRGIATHLRDVHTPWNPGKLAQKIHRRKHERQEREHERERAKKRRRLVQQEGDDSSNNNNNNDHHDDDDKKESIRFIRDNSPSVVVEPLTSWTPTEEDKKAWAAKIVQVLQKVEEERMISQSAAAENSTTTTTTTITTTTMTTILKNDEKAFNKKSKNNSRNNKQNTDKTGKMAIAYRESLPPFLMAASKGDIIQLQELVNQAKQKDEKILLAAPCTTKSATVSSKSNEMKQNNVIIGDTKNRNNNYHLRTLLDTSDRHKSTSDHWAAGGGHLDCLRYLYNLRATLAKVVDDNDYDNDDDDGNKVLKKHQELKNSSRNRQARRRDGKTCLHYAARNGHVHCIRYLLLGEEQPQQQHHPRRHIHIHAVDERSGEGTTPLHLACYGGHPGTVKYLIEKHGADALAKNDWGCTCAHWAAMTISESEDAVRELCRYLSQKSGGVSIFVETQGQGHTALHKAAHRRNRHVIQWMADDAKVDNGGAGLQQQDKERAGAPDLGGHKPSDIWRNMGGDTAFADWMKTGMGW